MLSATTSLSLPLSIVCLFTLQNTAETICGSGAEIITLITDREEKLSRSTFENIKE